MLKIDFDVAPLLRALDTTMEVLEKNTRPAAHAGAVVLYTEVIRRVLAKPEGKTKDLPREITENLLSSIYRKFAVDNSVPQQEKSERYPRASYEVSWNAGTAQHAWMVENGHIQYYVVRLHPDGYWYTPRRPDAPQGAAPSQRAGRAEMDRYYIRLKVPRKVPPYPFVRPAWDAKSGAALQAANDRMVRLVNEELREKGL